MKEKKFKLSKDEIRKVIEPMGSCFASDKITVDGFAVGYMYRDQPDFAEDSGWKFFSGTEDQEYINNPDNLAIYDVNTIANYDSSIIPYLHFKYGSELVKVENNIFKTAE